MDENLEDLVTITVGHDREPDVEIEQIPADPSWPVDEVCAAAIDLARAALVEEASEDLIGEHVGMLADGPLVVTHYFTGSVPGYTGWRWAVSLTRAPESDVVTVDETALLPDSDALLAPAWVPWKQRVESGDLGTGDVMVTEPDDPRLVAGMADNDLPELDDELRPQQWEIGLGRIRMLSPQGRRDAAQRWYREAGPRAASNRTGDLQCSTCGFLVLIGGPLGQGFGACANGYSPADGRIVALNFGCGAHSEMPQTASVQVAETVIDEIGFDDLGPAEPEPTPEAEAEPAPELEPEPSQAIEQASVETSEAAPEEDQ